MGAEINGEGLSFADQYTPLSKDVFRQIAEDALREGSDPDDQARRYAELGKPDFTLAYLLAGKLSDDARREVFARAYRQRADFTEERARAFDRKYHRAFPLLLTGAANDRASARRVLAGQSLNPRSGKQLPTL